MAKGEILAWINSDDFYEAGAFQKIMDAFQKEPAVDIFYGNGYVRVESDNTKIPVVVPKISYRRLLFRGCEIFQPSTFFTKKSFMSVRGIDKTLHYAFDYDLWLAMLKQGKASPVNEYLSNFRLWPLSKTSTSFEKFIEEEKLVLKRHATGFFGPYHFFILKRILKRITFYEKLSKLFSNSRHTSE